MFPVRSRCTLLSFLVVLLACGNETSGRPLTEVIVVIDADASLKSQAASLHVMVEGAQSVDTLDGRVTRLDEALDSVELPKRVAIIPRGGDSDRAFVLTATLLDGEGEPLAQARVISGFVKSEVRYAKLVIEGDACLQLKCTSDRQTCTNGSCVDATVQAEALSSTSKNPTELIFGKEGDETDSGVGDDPEMDAGTTVDGSEAPACAVDNGGCDTEPTAKCSAGTGGASACTCPPGYLGSGKGSDGCVDIDECGLGAVAACGEGAVGCGNGVGGFTCNCGAGFSGSGTKACTDIDECSRGISTVCGTGANGCTNKTGGYTCSCGGAAVSGATYAVNKDGLGCHARAWGAPVPVKTMGGAADEIALTVDGPDAVVAAWSQVDGPANKNIWTARFTTSSGWGMAVPLENGAGDSAAPVLAGNESGDLVVAWLELQSDASGGSRYNPIVRYRSRAGSWGAPQSIAAELTGTTRFARSLSAVMDAQGNAFVMWTQWRELWINQCSSSGGCGTATALSTGEPEDSPVFVLSTNQAGAVATLWRTNTTPPGLIVRRYGPGGTWSPSVPVPLSSNATETSLDNYGIVTDGGGNATLVWRQGANLWGNRLSAAGTWGTHRFYGSQAALLGLASDGANNIVMLSSQTDTSSNGQNLEAARYRASADTWDSSTQIPGAAPGSCSTRVNTNGNAVAVCSALEGGRQVLRATSSASGSTWMAPALLTDSGNPQFHVVAIDTAGNAIAIWRQGSDLWSARLE